MEDKEIKIAASPSDCKTLLVTSCKGGVGKSTVTANLAMALARAGKRTLAIDCDFSNRSLDLIFGCENSLVYDIYDVILGRCEIEHAIMRDERNENLLFCGAPLEADDGFDSEKFCHILDEAKEKYSLDFILIDTPGAVGETVKLVSPAATGALIIVSHQPTAARAAERTGIMLDGLGVSEQRLIVNCFDVEAVLNGLRSGINELIDRTRTQIIGIVPAEYELSLAQEFGQLCFQVNNKNMKKIAIAFDNIAARLCGSDIPLMKKVFTASKRRDLLES